MELLIDVCQLTFIFTVSQSGGLNHQMFHLHKTHVNHLSQMMNILSVTTGPFSL